MEKKIPSSTKVVVIGGGVVGCSVAYHLAKFGWKDTVLFERDQLTSGTTWHAAGLVSQLGPSAAITKIRKYTLDLYKELEKEVDHSAGLRLNGALSIAQNKGRWQELKRQATTAQLYDVDVRILDKNQIKKDYPIINTDEVIGGILMPGDGAADPSGVTHLLAKAARQEGAQIFEKSPVEEILTDNGKISGVKVNGKKIECEYIVLASGMWSRQIGEKVGVSIPLYPAEHFYIITEPIENLSNTLPVIRDFDNNAYYTESFNTEEETFLIRKYSDSGFEYMPAAMFTYVFEPDEYRINGNSWGASAGISLDPDKPGILGGISYIVGQNVTVTAGVAITQQDVLKGEYKAYSKSAEFTDDMPPQTIDSALSADQLVKDTYKGSWFLAIGFTFE